MTARRFAMLPTNVLSDLSLSDGAKLTYAALKLFANTDSECYPKQESIARVTSKSVSRVKEYVAELRRHRLVKTRRCNYRLVYTFTEPTEQGGNEGPANGPDGAESGDLKEEREGSDLSDLGSDADGSDVGDPTSSQIIQKLATVMSDRPAPGDLDSRSPGFRTSDRPDSGPRLYKEVLDQEKTSTPPIPPSGGEGRLPKMKAADETKIERILVDEWNELFPLTSQGLRNEEEDLKAIRVLLERGKSPDDIRGYYAFLKRSGKIQYFRRPYKLISPIDRGRGQEGWAFIEQAMAAGQHEPRRAPRRDITGSGFEDLSRSSAARMQRDFEKLKSSAPTRAQ